MTGLRAFVLLLGIAAASAAGAASFRGDGFRIATPESWATEVGVMGVPLMARPPRATDVEGWGQDLLTVTREPVDKRRTCLDAFTLRKIQQFAYHAERFEKLEEEALDLPGPGGGVATRLTLRYREGPRDLMAYVLVLDAGSHMLTATLTSSPARFEQRRAPFRAAVESLRAAPVAKAARRRSKPPAP